MQYPQEGCQRKRERSYSMNDSNALSDLQVTYECKMDDNKLFLEIVNPQDDGTFFYACYLQNKKEKI